MRLAGIPEALLGILLPLHRTGAIGFNIDAAAIARGVAAHEAVLSGVGTNWGRSASAATSQKRPDQAQNRERFHAVEDRAERRTSQGVS